MGQFNTNDRVIIDDVEPPLIRSGAPEGTPKPHHQNSGLSNSRYPLEGRIEQFRKTYFPDATDAMWNDWHWQLFHRITTYQDLCRFLTPTSSEAEALLHADTLFPFSVTPYYLSLIDPLDSNSALRKTVIPSIEESYVQQGESQDPLSEEHTTAVKGVVHRYPDRVLFLTTSFCSTYCRYCTRSRMVGGHTEPLQKYWEGALDYIREHKEIRDVIVSGGDPLTLSDENIDYLLSQLSSIEHVEMIRLGTKVPMVLPQRINDSLLSVLRRYKPLYLSIHATHPDELTRETDRALNALADCGIVMGSQTVLLKDVNDSVATLTELFHKLLRSRVKPYYLYQCDPILGSGHFRTTVDKGKELMQGIRGFTSGYAVPQYVIDTPGGGGKVPILPQYEVGQDDRYLYLRNYEGKIFTYPTTRECASCSSD
ncbi:MAG: KamA family radical SAM protein [Sphaerochaeta sp.]|jgi:lysine 2,3-aminomutase|uniref:KamA family radical SAM protein n=1 Tax=Sphaerochaeta sp. TaxID=1972642 RepID=UPI003D0BA42E